MNTHKIVGVVDPTTNQEAATKKYVDDNAGAGDVSAAVNLTANTIVQGDGGVKGVKTSTATVAQIASNVTHVAGDGSDHADVATNTTKISYTDAAAVALNTAKISVPIGSIIAWHKDFANTPALPGEFVECNGQTLSDGDSVYNGQVIPNMNDSKFIRGSSVSGTASGNDSHTHTDNLTAPAHTHTDTLAGPAHTHPAGSLLGPWHRHTGFNHRHVIPGFGFDGTLIYVDRSEMVTSGSITSADHYHGVVGSSGAKSRVATGYCGANNTGYSGTGAVTGNTGAASATALTGSVGGASNTALTGSIDSANNIPTHITMVWIMRIK